MAQSLSLEYTWGIGLCPFHKVMPLAQACKGGIMMYIGRCPMLDAKALSWLIKIFDLEQYPLKLNSGYQLNSINS